MRQVLLEFHFEVFFFFKNGSKVGLQWVSPECNAIATEGLM